MPLTKVNGQMLDGAINVDSSGNVGIGTSSPGAKLVSVSAVGSDAARFTDNTNYTLAIRQVSGQNRGLLTGTAGSSLGLGTDNTERLTIDSSGNVGIGTTSPSFTAGGGLMVQNGTQANLRLDRFGEGGFELQSVASTLRFYSTAASAERMRITSAGDLLVNTTTTNAAFKGFRMYSEAQGSYSAMGATGTGSYDFFSFYRGTDGSMPRIGFISTTGSGTSYSTTSDYRLKENIAPMTGALAKVAQLKPVTYTWKTDGSDGQGFIAHELQELCPDAVNGTKDEVDEEGNPKYQGVDTSFLVATLTAAIQELNAKVEAQAAEIAALKAAP